MNEFHITQEDAQTLALSTLVGDMRFVLGRIETACVLATFLGILVALLDAWSHKWVGAGLAVLGASCFFLCTLEAHKRLRKYTPGTTYGGNR